jgi:hypothetical protein
VCGSIAEQLRAKDKSQQQTVKICQDFVASDGPVKPVAKLSARLRCDGEPLGTPAIGRLFFQDAEKATSAKALQRGIDGTGAVAEMPERCGGELFAQGVAGE